MRFGDNNLSWTLKRYILLARLLVTNIQMDTIIYIIFRLNFVFIYSQQLTIKTLRER